MSAKMSAVHTLIHKLGGPSVVARECGSSFITGDAVTAWGLRDSIPWKWRSRVLAMATNRGVRLTAAERKHLSFEYAIPE